MPTIQVNVLDGIGSDDPSTSGSNINLNSGTMAGHKWKYFGQTSNNSGGNVANQAVGTASLPIIGTAGNSGTAVVNNSLVTANSIILLTVYNWPAAGGAGDATANRRVDVWVESIVAGTSFTIGYQTAQIMSQAWTVGYEIFN